MQNTINVLITVAIIAWVLQIALGWWQINRFNREFALLCKQGNVGVGRSSGRFKPKVVVAIAFDPQKNVVDAIMMKGLTVFSRPRHITALIGLAYDDIVPERIFPQDTLSQEALREAMRLK